MNKTRSSQKKAQLESQIVSRQQKHMVTKRAALSQIYTYVYNALSQNIKCLVNFPWKEKV